MKYNHKQTDQEYVDNLNAEAESMDDLTPDGIIDGSMILQGVEACIRQECYRCVFNGDCEWAEFSFRTLVEATNKQLLKRKELIDGKEEA